VNPLIGLLGSNMILSAPIIKVSSGLNTVADPSRIDYDQARGVADLSQAYNISIDDTGLISSRVGDEIKQVGSFHSLFCSGGACLVIQERTNDAALMLVNEDLTLTGLRGNLAKNAPMSFAQVNYDTYYSNGFQNGYVRERNSFSWPVSTYKGPDTNLNFTPAPVGSIVAFKPGGLMLIAEGALLWMCHEPFAFGLFNQRSGFVAFASDITMVCPTSKGVYVSDSAITWFLEGTTWSDFKQRIVVSYPALKGSLAHDKVVLRDHGIDQDGEGYIWASTKGVCMGLDDGSVINLTSNKVKYPSGYTSGACLITDSHIIHTVE